MREKKCVRCGAMKPFDQFPVDRGKTSGFGTYCGACDRERSREYYAKNRETVLAKPAAKRGHGSLPERFCREWPAEADLWLERLPG
jgi:hypothetical protein